MQLVFIAVFPADLMNDHLLSAKGWSCWSAYGSSYENGWTERCCNGKPLPPTPPQRIVAERNDSGAENTAWSPAVIMYFVGLQSTLAGATAA